MKRELIEKLIAWKQNPRRKPLILKGTRQVGKTYLLKHFGEQHFPRFFYVNFEKQPDLMGIFERDYNPARLLTELSFHFKQQINAQQDLLIFDTDRFGRVLVVDNNVQTTYLDEFVYHEAMVHASLCWHPNPQNVLIIGGGDGGILRDLPPCRRASDR